MPEGPEVRLVGAVIAEALDKRFLPKIIENTDRLHRFSTKGIPGWDLIKDGFTITGVTTKGKMICISVKNRQGETLAILNTLGMTGTWAFDAEFEKHARLAFFPLVSTPCGGALATSLAALCDGNTRVLTFLDQRCFGTIRVMPLPTAAKLLTKIGHDLLHAPAPPELWTSFQQHKSLRDQPVGEALLDQRFFSGIGNIYKAETLYSAGIHPFRLVRDLSSEEWERINRLAHVIMNNALQAGGSSVENFQANKQDGSFQQHLRVYGRKQCPQGHLVQTADQDGRTTWFCPTCQPAPVRILG